MKSIENRNNEYKSKPNLQLAFSGISSFSDLLFTEYDLFKPTTFIQICIYINFRIYLTQFYISFSRHGHQI